MQDTDVTAPGDEQPREVHVTADERAAALAAGAPRVPRRAIAWALIAILVLGLGGLVGERIVSAVGLNPTNPASPTTTTTSPIVTIGPAAGSSLLSFTPIAHVGVPRAVLRDDRGRMVPLAEDHGKVVVLTFFDASCADSCVVIASELRHADADLGAARSKVEFLTVNTDPLELAPTTSAPAVASTGLAALPNWRFLTGDVHTLNHVWDDFGVSISVYVDSKTVVHNDVLYLVNRRGQLVSRGSPFSDESHAGLYSLPPHLEAVAGRDLATAVEALLVPHR